MRGRPLTLLCQRHRGKRWGSAMTRRFANFTLIAAAMTLWAHTVSAELRVSLERVRTQ